MHIPPQKLGIGLPGKLKNSKNLEISHSGGLKIPVFDDRFFCWNWEKGLPLDWEATLFSFREGFHNVLFPEIAGF